MFLLGLLSAMDAVLDMDLADILKEINVREEIRDALLGATNPLRERIQFGSELRKRMLGGSQNRGPCSCRSTKTACHRIYFDAVNWAECTLLVR